jgi:hypothetical protein
MVVAWQEVAGLAVVHRAARKEAAHLVVPLSDVMLVQLALVGPANPALGAPEVASNSVVSHDDDRASVKLYHHGVIIIVR